MPRWFLLAALVGPLGLLVGCGTSPPPPVAISGTVELNGKPMKEGKVTLLGDAGTVPDTLEVKDGKFEGQATPGKKKVEIRAFKMGKSTKMGDTVIEATPENYIPSKYNTETTLSAEVGPSGINPNKFSVTAAK